MRVELIECENCGCIYDPSMNEACPKCEEHELWGSPFNNFVYDPEDSNDR